MRLCPKAESDKWDLLVSDATRIGTYITIR